MVLGSGVCINIIAIDGLSKMMFECLYDDKNSCSRYLMVSRQPLM